MSLELHMADERARTAGLSPAEREWRMKWIKDQHLHADEPIHVDAVHRQLNPVRVLYRKPWDNLYKHFLRPSFGVYYGTLSRILLPKLLMVYFALCTFHYYNKYEAKGWEKHRGIRSRPIKSTMESYDESEAQYPGINERARYQASKYGYSYPDFAKRLDHIGDSIEEYFVLFVNGYINYGLMKQSRLVNYLILVTLIFLIYYFWFLEDNVEIGVEKIRNIIFDEFCQFLERPLSGDEGGIKDPFKFRGLLVLFRHGERSPLIPYTSKSSPDCSPFHETDRRSFDSYMNLIDELNYYIAVDPMFSNFPRYPSRSTCEIGHLTAEGALQLVRLGNFLRRRYENSNLFNSLNHNISATSSVYPRTFQSALAFISSFVDLRKKPVRLNASNTTYFCTNDDCTCSAMKQIRVDFEKERSDYWYKNTSSILRQHVLDNLAPILGLSTIKHPLDFIDVVLGRHACRRLPLPCRRGNCLTSNDVEHMTQEESETYKQLFKHSKTMRKLFVVEATGVLRHAYSIIQKLRKNSKGDQIQILSGHDISIEPLIFTLNLKHRVPPHYASRFVIEVYELPKNFQISDETIFMRVLLNGVDQTFRLPFCQPLFKGLCAAHRFEKFINDDLLKISGLTTFSEICA
uniref:NADH dehydrogenase [ubiquinone] 1 beta subcomplex subunit 6 n=1 Tax=Acrobeloides nanus TaxID=290746 RepID=A0A914CP61_9BILA